MISELIKLRQELHKFPELSGAESNTALRIKAFIDTHNPTTIIENLGGSGLAAVYEFSQSGPTIAIRCELDALPIEEENNLDYKSAHKSVSHKCGHDGHMAIVGGLIFWLKEQSFETGKIILLFQPAEETGEGAYKVLEDQRFAELDIDFIFALHNIPGEPAHSILTMSQGFSAEVQSFSLSLIGEESHAAEPSLGINPANAIGELISAYSKLNRDNPLEETYSVLTPVHITMGQKSYGISPANGELHYTVRTWSSAEMTNLKQEIERLSQRVSDKYQLTSQLNWFEYFPASENNQECNRYISEAALKCGFKEIKKKHPFKFGEDFGWFSKKYKTGMFGLGAGYATPPLHNAHYDFPDALIETGIRMFKEIIGAVLRK